MAGLRLAGLAKAYGETRILRDINLEVTDGEFIVFVGPSGCGKSTLLRVIAGLEDTSEGTLHIGEREVSQCPPAERGIAMVFQSYALYPHMNLYENMAFGLKLAKVPKAEIDSAIRQAAKVLHIDHLLERKPKDLSGGQRQRVAIGRAIVRKPEVFLFDEPLSNLDAALRVKMRYEFARLHDELKTTMIYVTHDQVEAMTLADRIVVLNAGQIEQVGAPLELYEHPCNVFVAGFIGTPRMNFLPATLERAEADHAIVRTASGNLVRCEVDAAGAANGARLTLGVRPEHLTFAATPGTHASGNAIQARVTFVERLGGTSCVYLTVHGVDEPITLEGDGNPAVSAGDEVSLHFAPSCAYLFDEAGRAFKRLKPGLAGGAA